MIASDDNPALTEQEHTDQHNEANAEAIDAAAAAGVTIVGIDSAVHSDQVAAYIGSDNYGAGRLAARSALEGGEVW